MSKLLFSERAWMDYLSWQAQDKKILVRINTLLRDIGRDPYRGIGKPEPLRGELSGFWSRRVDAEHRLVYRVAPDVIEIISCRGHYGD